jgi:hypothetical protein
MTQRPHPERVLILAIMVLTLSVIVRGGVSSNEPSKRIGNLQVTVHKLAPIVEVGGRKAKTGTRFVELTGTIRNVGKQAVCAMVSSRLLAEYGIEEIGWVQTGTAENLSDYALIRELLPNEQMNVKFVFELRKEVEPKALLIKQVGSNQACGRENRIKVRETRITIPLKNILAN